MLLLPSRAMSDIVAAVLSRARLLRRELGEAQFLHKTQQNFRARAWWLVLRLQGAWSQQREIRDTLRPATLRVAGGQRLVAWAAFASHQC